MPAALAALLPIAESSTTQHLAGSTFKVFAARRYTSGEGFLFSTTSPAKICNLARRSGPKSTLAMVVTAASLLVEHMATFRPMAKASSMRRVTPGRLGTAPDSTALWNNAVLRLCSSFTNSCLSATPSGQPTLSKYTVMRSLPPPVASNSPYSSTSHSLGRPFSLKAWLKVTRWQSRSVSAITPSQSKSSASKWSIMDRPILGLRAEGFIVKACTDTSSATVSSRACIM
mmetsp:Transcript_10313/g.22874  ORF Transcript_10313/g.22874 Transcript_10313/m.22874 type:complete len:229 (+) Transcript_10313:396-1082(+)